MLITGSSYSETLRIKGFQLVMSLYGDPDQIFECCITATVSNAERADEENKESTVPSGFREVTLSKVQAYEKALRKWLREHDNEKFHRFDVDDVYSKLISLFRKAGYTFK